MLAQMPLWAWPVMVLGVVAVLSAAGAIATLVRAWAEDERGAGA